jgi:RNA polymerase sigma-70 factor (ECF subfamily)
MAPPTAYARALQPLLPHAAAYARALLRNRHDAEDAVQHAALRGLQQFNRCDANRSFKAWWFTILRNHCLDILRARRSARTEPLGDYDPPAPTTEPQFDWARLDAAILRLSPEHRELLRLRYFAELSYKELAETLQIPAGTVMSRLHLARHALRRFVQEDNT